jgi:hypothetical protein
VSSENEDCTAVQPTFEEQIEETGIRSRLSVSQEFGSWMAGFTDGEGNFKLRTQKRKKKNTLELCFKIELRDDDTSAMTYIQKNLAPNRKLNFHRQREPKVKAKPGVTFKLCAVKDLAEVIVPLFEAYPLHTKKSREFEIWKKIVLMKYRHTACGLINYRKQPGHYETYCAEFDKAEEEINNIRTYRGRG